MVACYSLKSLLGSSFGFDAKDRKRQTQIVRITFLSCTKNISKHWSTLSFSGLQNEIDLVLSREALVDQAEERIKSMTVCPRHRATLGIKLDVLEVEEQGAEIHRPFQNMENQIVKTTPDATTTHSTCWS